MDKWKYKIGFEINKFTRQVTPKVKLVEVLKKDLSIKNVAKSMVKEYGLDRIE